MALMDRGVHGVGADRALEQLVDAGGRGDDGGAVGLEGRAVGKGGHLLVHPIDR